MTDERGLVIVVGAGPAIGASVARCFSREGHPVGLVARNPGRLAALVGELDAAVSTIVGAVGPGKTHEPDAIAEHLSQRHAARDDALTVLR